MAESKLFNQAKKFIPGGVNSPARAFSAVKMTPPFIKRAKGQYIYDTGGHRYIDYLLSWGAVILGHADRRVTLAAGKALKGGSSFGAPTEQETELALLLAKIYPSIEKARLTSSGTEAAMSAVRLARGYTGKNKIIKFEGCYHGHSDSLLVKAGSPAAGVTASTTKDTIIVAFNDIEALKKAIIRHKNDIACLIIEPIPANMGVILPKQGFLSSVRKITRENNILLIFDEVVTGFRAALGGAQELFSIKPDLTILGKILGAGFPMGAFGGRHQIMDLLAPEGRVYQAGTLSGNPVTVSAGLSALRALIGDKNIYKKLEQKAELLEAGIREAAREANQAVKINRAGSLFTVFFTAKTTVDNYSDAASSDLNKFGCFFRGMLRSGIYLAPSQFEANFLCVKHTFADIEKTIRAAQGVFKKLD